jgi:hypothetical protein
MVMKVCSPYKRTFLQFLLTYGAEPFLRSWRLCSHSATSQHFMEPEGSLPRSQEPSGPRLLMIFRNKLIFYGEELLAPRPNPKLVYHPLSAVSSIRNLKTRSVVVTRDPPKMGKVSPMLKSMLFSQEELSSMIYYGVNIYIYM